MIPHAVRMGFIVEEAIGLLLFILTSGPVTIDTICPLSN